MTATLWPKLHSYSPRFIPGTVNRRQLSPIRSLRQQASAPLITHRPAAAPFTTHLKTPRPRPRPQSQLHKCAYYRGTCICFSSTRPVSASQELPQSISGGDWEKLSPEAKIQWLGDDKWGWVEDLKRRVQQGVRDSIAGSDAPGIATTMDFRFIEDPALENAPIENLQRRFQAWAREDNAAGSNIDHVTQGSRYGFFLRVDGEALWNGYVGLVRAWPESPGSEDWMKIRASAIGPELYIELDNPEV